MASPTSTTPTSGLILSKANEESSQALTDAGYDGSFSGEAHASIFYQNANHSVRVTDGSCTPSG
jgi:hypothetical protein